MEVAVKTVLFSKRQGGQDPPQQRAVMEAAISASAVHRNVVTT